MSKRSSSKKPKVRRPLKWSRTILPLDWNSDYVSWDGTSKFKILRHRKTGRVQLFVWRENRENHTEKYDYLPSVRFAKQIAETRLSLIHISEPTRPY